MENVEIYLLKNFPHVDASNIQPIIECATEDIFNYCNITEVPQGLKNTLLQMCIHKINTMHEAGIKGVQGVVTMSYDFDYPPQIIKNLRRFRKLA